MTESASDPFLERLQQLSTRLKAACDHLELLDATGHVPSTVPVGTTLQHTVTAQSLSRDTALLAAEFTARFESPSDHLSKARSQLLTAVTDTCNATTLFAQTARTAATPPPSRGTPDADRWQWQLILDHAHGRGALRRASDAVSSAGGHVKNHHEMERLLAELRGRAATPSPSPTARTNPRR
ncbi:hypothetical protein [Streptomyces sp. UNOC14_S4]|uniref:hypothetical protein n=1 Tax=Streptomyces sp. UNOC14_S4 TaxID=2872340 RepID=UPI001E3973FD|nr:hypothetical protein [Streptomyces sp. UNOC14_S4]MCC3772558.1 hypothetical protein [Streptomyces sp. UNOC14_S4]